jgi:hypothetical protein
MKNIILSNIENYKNNLDSNEHILFLKYIGLIHELIQGCVENIFIQESDYLKYILIKGIKNTFYIYTFLLLYTKNLELSVYHTQKSIIYYIEFISQIGEDTNNLLKLNSKDATLFIYKKTIFEVNEDVRKNYSENDGTKSKLDMVHLYIDFYNNIIIHVITKFDFKTNKLEDLQKIVFTKLYKIVDSIIQLPLLYKNNQVRVKHKLEELHILLNIFNNSYSYEFINKNYLYLLEYCIKKIHKIEIDDMKIKNKLNELDIESKLQDCSVCKIFNYLLL